jgi:hypothetical protein
MALSLPNKTDPANGASTTYFRIDAINLPGLTTGGVLRVGAYVDSNTAKSLQPVVPTEVTLTDAEMATLRAGVLGLLYPILAARPEYSGSINV